MSTPRKRDFLKRVANRFSQSSAGGSTSPGPSSTTSPASSSALTSNATGLHLEPRSRAILDAALKELDEDERETISRNSLNASTDIDGVIRQAYEAAVEKKELSDKKRWEWTFAGRTLVLRDEAGKLARWLDRFKAVGDVVANVDPLHVGLPWAGIRMLLVMTVAGHQQAAALITGMSLVLAMVNRLQVYWAFLDGLPPSAATSNLEKALVNMYVHILRFICRAIRTYERNSVQRLAEALWAQADLEDFEMECDKIAQRAEVEASNCDRELNHRNWRDLRMSLKRIDQEQGKLEKIQDSITQSSIKANLQSLATAEHAVYNSHADEDLNRCTDGTRTAILDHIYDWASNPDSKSIFWLRGMAGTGKSTILRTAAHHLDNKNQRLGASFFFKKGEGDRGNAKRFFPTIAVQLAAKIPGLDQAISSALDREPFAADLSLRVQFDKLILSPLLDLGLRGGSTSAALTIVIDALDECDRITDIQNMIQMLGEVGSRSGLRLRILVSSRPDIPIVTSLERLDSSLHEDIVLEDMQTTTIEHDICLFLENGFAEIRRRDADINPDDSIPDAWPAAEDLQSLVHLSNPLFIFAATVCRFISSARDPQRQLAAFLQQQQSHALSGLDAVYLPILLQSIEGYSTTEQDSAMASFRLVVGSIITLNEALSAKSLAHLLGLRPRDIRDTLRDLHSIIKVPKDSTETIHLFHLSFQDFLLEKTVHADHPFHINPDEAHMTLWQHCIRVLQGSLKRDIFNIGDPGRERGAVTDTAGGDISADLAYACRNWVHHLEKSQMSEQHHNRVLAFLEKHLLHWVEVMSWLGRVYECSGHLRVLTKIYSSDIDPDLASFLYDAYRFVQYNSSILHDAPLQLYASALLFAPTNSKVRYLFKQDIMVPLNFIPDIKDDWGPETQVFEAHSPVIDFSPDGHYFAYSDSRKLIIWDLQQSDIFRELLFEASIRSIQFLHNTKLRILVATDEQTHLTDLGSISEIIQYPKLEGTSSIEEMKASPDGAHFATLDHDGTLEVWNVSNEERLWSHRIRTSSLGFAIDITDEAIAVLSDDSSSFQLLRIETGDLLLESDQPRKYLTSNSRWSFKNIAFSPDRRSIALTIDDKQTVIFDMPEFKERKRLCFEFSLLSCSYSTDNQYLVVHGFSIIQIVAVDTGLAVATFDYHPLFPGVRLAPDNKRLAMTTVNDTVILRTVDSEGLSNGCLNLEEIPTVIVPWVESLAGDSSGDRLLSLSYDNSIDLWDSRTGKLIRTLWSTQKRPIKWACFLPDSQKLVTASLRASEFCIRDTSTGIVVKQRVVESPLGPEARTSLTANGRLIVVYDCDDGVTFFLDAVTLTEVEVLHCFCDKDERVRVSWNTRWFPGGIPYIGGRCRSVSEQPAVAADEQTTDHTITLSLDGARYGVESFLISPGGELMAIQTPKGKVHIVSTKAEEVIDTLTSLSVVTYMAFSPESSCLAVVGLSPQNTAELHFWGGSAATETKQFSIATSSVTAMAIRDADGSIVCSTPYADVYCYDVGTGDLLYASPGRFSFESAVSFSQDGRYLLTREGSITLDHDRTDGCMKILQFDRDRYGRWIRRKGRNVIWIPPEYRGSDINRIHYSAESPHQFLRDTLAIERSSGRGQLAWLQFKDDVK